MPQPPPDETSLHEAALAHLARYATTRAGLRRVLSRRVERWVKAQPDGVTPAEAEAAKNAVDRVVARLAAAGVVDDAAFAEARAARLVRSGHSARAIAAHLSARGVDQPTISRLSQTEPETEFAAALRLAARRRIGPFRASTADETTPQRELGVMARAGFPHEVAVRVLRLDRSAAEAVLQRLRQQERYGGV